MRLGLIGRLLIGGLVIAIFFLAQTATTIRSNRAVRDDTRTEQRAEQSVVAAIRIEKLVLDLETGARGYVITRNGRFLRPWREARRQLPQQSAQLKAVAPGPFADRLDGLWRAYVREWSLPIVRLARTDPAQARTTVAQGGGLRRVDRIRDVIDPYVAREGAAAVAARHRVAKAENRANELVAYGIAVRVVVFLLVIAWILRGLVVPIRRLAAATSEVARTGRGVVVPPGGAGEVGDLTAAFNEMSRSLERSREELQSQNADLERLANVLRAVLDSTVDGILLSDADGNVQLANRPVMNLTRDLGMSFDGTVVDRLLSVEPRIKDADRYRAAMERLRLNPNEPTFDEFEDTVSGRVFQGFTNPVLDDRGQFLGRVWTLREVTEQRELDRLKDDFVATVSHELRTPLTSMMGFLEMIREGEAGQLTDEQKRFLTIVYRSSERLQRLVGDLLFVARLDANGLQLQFGDVRVQDVAHDCVENSSALARTREIDLVAELDATVPPVWGDRERLSQLVSNLVSNAIKFTPAGGRVTVRAFVDAGDAVLQVEDTGIGIPKGEQERLFQRFFRSSTATEQAIPGTGLGLVISKAIAEAHGGRISVRSDAGQGTCFTVRLPFEQEEVAA
ncbi:MAG TPA: ATP-binding protein [Gaiellaceae bacterium]